MLMSRSQIETHRGNAHMLLELVNGIKERRLASHQHVNRHCERENASTSSSSMTGLGAREATEGKEGARRGGIYACGVSSSEELKVKGERDDRCLNKLGSIST
jgi:hypothetical protein